MNTMRVDEWLREAEVRLWEAGVDSPRIDAQVLAAHVLRVERSWLFAHPEHEMNDLAGESVLFRRIMREPLAYIVGHREFYGRRFGVTPDTLIPRQETETLIELALGLKLPERATVLDIGTGSGCIAVTLKLERPLWEVTAVDISPDALAVASANARFLGADIRFIHSDTFSGVFGETFDLIVSNPPYVASFEKLMPEIAEHEPKGALFSGDTGYEFYQRLSKEAKAYVEDGGFLAVEVGDGQGPGVRKLLEQAGWTWLQTERDLSGTQRVVVAMHSFV